MNLTLARGALIGAVPLVAARALGALRGSGDESVLGGVTQPLLLIVMMTAAEWWAIRRDMRAALEVVGAMRVRDATMAGVRETLPISGIVIVFAIFQAAIGDWDLAAVTGGILIACTLRIVLSDLMLRFWERRDAQRYLLRAELSDDETLLCEPL